jgi:hypothetical protein
VLQFQELLLALQAAGVAGQLAVAADDPVAGDQDAQRVAAHRGADFLGVLAATKTAGEVAAPSLTTVRSPIGVARTVCCAVSVHASVIMVCSFDCVFCTWKTSAPGSS